MKTFITTLVLATTMSTTLEASSPTFSILATLSTSMPSAVDESIRNLTLRIGASGNSEPAFSPGTSCSDEGDWFCMTSAYQRCASGAWSVIFDAAPGTQCAPPGQSHNGTIPPIFSIGDSSSVPVSSAPSVAVPATKTMITTIDVTVSRPSNGAATNTATTVIVVGASATPPGSSATTSATEGDNGPKKDISGGRCARGSVPWVRLTVLTGLALRGLL